METLSLRIYTCLLKQKKPYKRICKLPQSDIVPGGLFYKHGLTLIPAWIRCNILVHGYVYLFIILDEAFGIKL